MALFRYEAVDRTGKVVRGVMDARDEQQVAQKLTAMGYSARGVYGGGGRPAAQAVRQPASPPPAAQSTARGSMQSVTLASGVPVSVKSKVPASVLAMYFRQMATLVRSGMPIHQAVTEMSASTRNPILRQTLLTLQETTRGGRYLSSALAEFPKVFPVHTIASVWAGELGGRLDNALEEIATDLELEASETRYGRIGWGVVKFHLILVALLLPMANLMDLMLPGLEEANRRGGNMSAFQVLQVVFDNYLRHKFPISAIAILTMVGCWIAWGYIKRIPSVRWALDEVLLHVPVWGGLHKARSLGRFLHVADGLYAAGIGPGQTWDAASLTVRNSAAADRLRKARGNLSANAGVSEMVAASGLFEPEEVAMAASGEKTGQVPEVMGNMSAIYQDRFSAAKTRNRFVSVLLLNILIGVCVVFVFYHIVAGYVALAEKAAEVMGAP